MAAAVAVAAVTQAMAAAVRVALRAAEALAAASAHRAAEEPEAAPARRAAQALAAASAHRAEPAAANRVASKTSSGTRGIIGFTAPRPDYGAVIVANDGERIYAVESRRDVEPGPLGIPWRSRFRLAAYDEQGAATWTFAAPPDDVVSDVAVHPSGDVTIAVLHFSLDRMAYDLVRLDRNGVVLGTMTTVGAADDARDGLWPVGSAADVPHEVGLPRRHCRRLGPTAAGRRRPDRHVPLVPRRAGRTTR